MRRVETEEEIEALLDESPFEEHGCETSTHATEHKVFCGKPAFYFFRGYDVACERWTVGYLCTYCAPIIVKKVREMTQCCHMGHEVISISCVRVGL